MQRQKLRLPVWCLAVDYSQSSPAEKEELGDLYDDLKKLELRVTREIGKLVSKEKLMKNAPRNIVPKFNNSSTGFLSFLEEFNQACQTFSDQQKTTAIKAAIVGKDEQEN